MANKNWNTNLIYGHLAHFPSGLRLIEQIKIINSNHKKKSSNWNYSLIKYVKRWIWRQTLAPSGFEKLPSKLIRPRGKARLRLRVTGSSCNLFVLCSLPLHSHRIRLIVLLALGSDSNNSQCEFSTLDTKWGLLFFRGSDDITHWLIPPYFIAFIITFQARKPLHHVSSV